MSTTPAPSKAQKTRKEKEKDKEREREKERKATLPTERLKTVVRRLPPNLPEDIFWQSVQPWVTDETALWKVYYPGKLRKRLNKENIPSRAYIAFKDEEQLSLFSKEYDGHVFRDKAGVESQAVVEFAPYQKVPSEKRKPDTRNATIEKDEDYISFIEALKASENAEPVPLETLIASSQPPPPPKTTPLLEALKAEKSANRDKEAILRNHAHYNQIITRKEDKKKAAAAALSASKQEASTAVPGGKKSSKKGQAANGIANSAATQSGKNAIPSTSKNPPTTAPATNAATPSKPAKGSKPPRAPPPSKVSGEGKAQQGSKNGEESSHTSVAQVSIAVPSTPSTDGAAPAPAPRRSRPVIGLASRHFEAALSGVAGLANAATERKKREKEREAQAAVISATQAGSGVTPSQIPVDVSATFARIDGSDNEKSTPLTPVLTTSPRKKTRRGTRRGGHHADADTEGTSTQVKVPSILQRADAPPTILQKDGPAITNSVLPAPAILTASSSVNAAANNTRGSGRRGRGGGGRGGVGRGGPPSAPRGG